MILLCSFQQWDVCGFILIKVNKAAVRLHRYKSQRASSLGLPIPFEACFSRSAPLRPLWCPLSLPKALWSPSSPPEAICDPLWPLEPSKFRWRRRFYRWANIWICGNYPTFLGRNYLRNEISSFSRYFGYLIFQPISEVSESDGDEWMNEWMNGWMNKWMNVKSLLPLSPLEKAPF